MSRPLYPFLLTIYPVLMMASANVEEISPMALSASLLVTVLWVAACWAVASLMTEDVDRRALWTLAGGAFFSWFGLFSEAVRESWVLESFHTPGLTEALWAVTLAMATWVAHRRQKILTRSRRGLNVFAFILVGFPLLSSGQTLLASAGDSPVESHDSRVRARSAWRGDSLHFPDIYLIVLDKYSGGESLRKRYNYDIGRFESSLRDRGFHVPTRSAVNYVHTAQSLASMLNWDYLDNLVGAREGSRRTTLYHLIEESRTWSFLEQRGYRFAFSPSSYRATTSNRHADLVLPVDPVDSANKINFFAAWISSTPLRAVHGFSDGGKKTDGPFPYAIEGPERMDRKFELLARMPEREGSWFVFAHLLLPHEPYIYNADCSHRRPWWPLTDRGADSLAVHQAYLDQVTCLNRKLTVLIDRLKETSGVPPVILIQGDHGHGQIATNPLRGEHLGMEDMTTDQIQERASTFAAYSLPGSPDTLFYEGMTPVNLLPTVFNRVFDSHLPRREDITYWTDFRQPHEHIPIR